jgi:hypothetical protein
MGQRDVTTRSGRQTGACPGKGHWRTAATERTERIWQRPTPARLILRCFLILLRDLCSGVERDDLRGPSRGEEVRVVSLRCLVRCRALSGDAGSDHRVEGAEHIGVTGTLDWRQGRSAPQPAVEVGSGAADAGDRPGVRGAGDLDAGLVVRGLVTGVGAGEPRRSCTAWRCSWSQVPAVSTVSWSAWPLAGSASVYMWLPSARQVRDTARGLAGR